MYIDCFRTNYRCPSLMDVVKWGVGQKYQPTRRPVARRPSAIT